IDTHFWYNVLPTIARDNSVIEGIKRKSVEKTPAAIIFSSVWDGVGSAALPTLIRKFKAANMDSLSIAVLPSKIQPTDAQFNAYAALKMCSDTDGATVLLMERDGIESFDGVDRRGELIKGNNVANYLLKLLLSKDTLVEEISELSRTFTTKMFTPIVVTGASYKIYGTLENMLDTALLKPFLTFSLSTATIIYVVLRMSSILKDKLPRGRIELAITNWFKEKTSLKSIYLTEPIYTDDMTDRIDAVLFVGGFDTSRLFGDLEKNIEPLKNGAVEKGLMTADWRVELKIEEPPKPDEPVKAEGQPTILEATEPNVETPKVVSPGVPAIETSITKETENAATTEPLAEAEEPKNMKIQQAFIESTPLAEEPKTPKPKRTRRTRKSSTS
ncbi:MAG TPA: hypothetical protein VK253_09145, partial [Candidatus Binatia bacterium]|nr:hypothetical protein [Candidatus Binatia bacterium]